MSRDVLVKQSLIEGGIGSKDASPLWESDPTDEGAIVRLDGCSDGTYFFSLTDAEEFDGAYASVAVTLKDLLALAHVASDLVGEAMAENPQSLQTTFREAVNRDREMTAEEKAYWLSVCDEEGV